jgi:O-acetyl-ADP-ribose deacetylase (regulator of RNase III)
MPLRIVRNDITKMKVDAIVNAANTRLEEGGGVCGAIFSAANAEKLKKACDKIGECETGDAVITDGFDLPAKYIIHTTGPLWQGGLSGEEKLLKRCYLSALELALQYHCQTVAIPLVSSGVYGYPKILALDVATGAIREFLKIHDMMVYLVVYDKNTFVISESLFSAIERFIDDKYVEEHYFNRAYSQFDVYKKSMEESEDTPDFLQPAPMAAKLSLEDVISRMDENFSHMLLRLIDQKGYTDVETYKRANIDRKLFSKIRANNGYNPSKQTAIAFAVALKLNLDETHYLLGKAGYALSRSSKFDVIIEYFIKEGNYDIFQINEALFAFDQSLLGA